TLLATRNPWTDGRAFYDAAYLPVGTHTITVVYNGNATDFPSTSAPIEVTVVKGDSTPGLYVEPDHSTAGQAVTLTVNVAGYATGAVEFFNGTTSLGTATLLRNPVSQGHITTTSLPVGTNSISAHYGGDSNLNPGDSQVVQHTVSAITSTTAL